MNQEGILRCRYIIEENEELQNKVLHMVKMDGIAQWLAGDELKRDSFKFLYSTMEIAYDCAFKVHFTFHGYDQTI